MMKFGGEISGRGANPPVPRRPPPFCPKPEKITPREAYSVVSGPTERMSGAPGMSSKLMKGEVGGGGMTAAGALRTNGMRARTPTSRPRISIETFPLEVVPAPARAAGAGSSCNVKLRNCEELCVTGQAERARSRQIGQPVERQAAGRRDAEVAHEHPGVPQAVVQITRRRPVLDDRLRRPLPEGSGVRLRRTEQPVRRLRVERLRGERIEAHRQRGH